MDDVTYFAEPFFQDGIIAQAVDSVVTGGVAYFSAAGNHARQSHQSITIPGLTTVTFSFQWDSPFFSVSGSPGTQYDLDIYFLNAAATQVLSASVFNNIGGDAVEVLSFHKQWDDAG